MHTTIYSAGYQHLKVQDFVAFVTREHLVVADVRLKPVSRNFVWNKNALTAALGTSYVWIEELGNLNYKGGPIVLKDEAHGLDRLRALLAERSVVVLCVCADPAICHRTVVIRKLGHELAAVPLPSLTGSPALF